MPSEPTRRSIAERLTAIPISWVRQADGWTLYSRYLNFVYCAAEDDATGDLWLGTRSGIKRVGRDGTLRQIYTGADGLPGHILRALAVEPVEAWCIVVPDHRPGRYALCRLDRATDRWELLREVTPPPSNVWSSHEPEYPDFLAASSPRYLACVFGHIARRENGFAFCVWNRERGTWQDVSWEPERRLPSPRHSQFHRDCFPEPSWLHVAGDAAYLGSAAGLGRYDLSSGTWEWLLGEYSVVGGAADGETLWLVAWKNGAVRGSFPDLLCLDAATGKSVTHLSPIAETASLPQHTRVTVIPDAGNVWLIEQKVAPGHAPEPTPPLIISFEAATENWQNWDAAASASDMPPAVRLAAALACAGPPLDELRAGLPGWFSPAADLPVVPEDVRYQPPPVRLTDTGEAAAWTVADRSVLVRQPQDSGPEQRFPLPNTLLPITPPISSVAILNDVLYAATSDGLWRRSLPGGDWSLIPLPEAEPNRRIIPRRLLTAAGYLWIEASDALLRYEPVLSEFRQIALASSYARLRLLNADQDTLWLTGGSSGQNLFRLEVQSLQLAAVPIQTEFPPMPAPPGFRYPCLPASVSAGIVWYSQTFEPVQFGHTKLIGYDLDTNAWTQPLRVTGHIGMISFYANEGSVFVAFGPRTGGISHGGSGDVYRYDLGTGQWEEAAPAPPRSASAAAYSESPPLQIVSVTSESIWLVNPLAVSLWRWDRPGRTWTEYTIGSPLRMSDSYAAGTVCPHGDEFFVASDRGLWLFGGAESSVWTRFTFPSPAASRLELSPRFINDQAVWALCYDTESRQTFAARFDKRAQTWRLWDEREGFPVGKGLAHLVSDGTYIVVMTFGGGFFYLDPVTERWREETKALSQAWAGQEGVHVSQPELVSSPPDVWLHGTGYWDDEHNRSLPPQSLAMRWNAAEGFIRMEPLGWTPPTDADIRLLGSDLRADDEAVWIMNLQGLWIWAKADCTWNFLGPPPTFPDRHGLTLGHIERTSDGAIWLIGRETLLRWAAPEAEKI